MEATTAQFVQASSQQKETLLIDGISFINESLKQGADNMKRLNAWLRVFNSLGNAGELRLEQLEALQKALSDFAEQLDNFTDHAMIASLLSSVTVNKIIVSHLKKGK
jgi:hypothetical protein